MRSKKGVFNFVLLFALIAGASILVLFIYGAVKSGEGIRRQTDAEIAKSLDIVTEPLQAGFADSSTSQIEFQTLTRINNDCSSDSFGENRLSVSTKASIGAEYLPATTEVSVKNKYIFSEYQEGEKFFVFSKNFEMPLKVTDLLFISAKDYCFVNSPEDMKEEITSLNIQNIKFEESGDSNCTKDSERICFGSGDCDTLVKGECTSRDCKSIYDKGVVQKSDGNYFFVENLIYGAIFSDRLLYECNVERLLHRTSKLTEVLARKADLMNIRECNTQLKDDLVYLSNLTREATIEDLEQVYDFSLLLKNKISRERSSCSVW